MDYEKAYKHALDLAKQVHDTTISKQQKENIEIIFPELKESANDKIRKDLIGFFKDEAFLCHKREEIIAWLEKQDFTWSEEDERMYSIVFEEYKNRQYYSHPNLESRDINGEILDWFKSIKQRIGG